jgi:hypothetical protein
MSRARHLLDAVGALLAAAALFLGLRGGTIGRFIAIVRRAFSRATDRAILLGCLHYGRWAYVLVEDLVLVQPPRTGTSGELADWILRQSAAAMVTSTCPDVIWLDETGEADEAGEVS